MLLEIPESNQILSVHGREVLIVLRPLVRQDLDQARYLRDQHLSSPLIGSLDRLLTERLR